MIGRFAETGHRNPSNSQPHQRGKWDFVKLHFQPSAILHPALRKSARIGGIDASIRPQANLRTTTTNNNNDNFFPGLFPSAVLQSDLSLKESQELQAARQEGGSIFQRSNCYTGIDRPTNQKCWYPLSRKQNAHGVKIAVGLRASQANFIWRLGADRLGRGFLSSNQPCGRTRLVINFTILSSFSWRTSRKKVIHGFMDDFGSECRVRSDSK
jgi:hypothetical protein